MAAAIGLRGDFDTTALWALAKRRRMGRRHGGSWRSRRSAGATRGEMAKIGGVTLQIVRDWVLRFNTLGSEGLVDRKAPGQPPLLNEEQRAALARVPTPAIHGVVRWRIIDLCQWLFEGFRICVSETTVSRELLKMGYRSSRPGPDITRSARPRDRETLAVPARQLALEPRFQIL